jgi:hypothetical protein
MRDAPTDPHIYVYAFSRAYSYAGLSDDDVMHAVMM